MGDRNIDDSIQNKKKHQELSKWHPPCFREFSLLESLNPAHTEKTVTSVAHRSDNSPYIIFESINKVTSLDNNEQVKLKMQNNCFNTFSHT